MQSTCEERSVFETVVGSWIVTDLTPARITFFAISMPRPPRPTRSTFEALIFCMASWPSTYLIVSSEMAYLSSEYVEYSCLE